MPFGDDESEVVRKIGGRKLAVECEDCGGRFAESELVSVNGELSCPKCTSEEEVSKERDHRVFDAVKRHGDSPRASKEQIAEERRTYDEGRRTYDEDHGGKGDDDGPLDPDAQGVVHELEPVEAALRKLDEVLIAQGKGKEGSFLARIFGSGSDPLALVREASKAARAELEVARRVARAGRLRNESERAALEQSRRELEKKVEAQFAVAKLDNEAKAQHALAIANDRMQLAREAMASVEDARKLRDQAMSGMNVVRSQILGLARSLGAQIVKADEKEALAWLVANARGPATKQDRELRDAALADKLARAGMTAEVERAARNATDASVKAELSRLAAEWRQAYTVSSTAEQSEADQRVEAAREKITAATINDEQPK